MGARPLVVIIDEEARANLSSLGFRWFYSGKKQEDNEWIIETPVGEKRKVTGTLVGDHRLGEHSEEYLYLELTPYCQFRCSHCGIQDDVVSTGLEKAVRDDVKYMTPEFAEKIAATFTQSGRVPARQLVYGGGEPLISPGKFGEIHPIFKNAHNTKCIVITNGYSIPLFEGFFEEFLAMTNISAPDNIYISSSDAHSLQYAKIAEKNLGLGLLPDVENNKEALSAKILRIKRLCKVNSIGFRPIVLGERNGIDLRAYILKAANEELAKEILNDANYIEKDGKREPCRQGQETSIRANGDVYPYCFDIYRKEHKIGVAGLLTGGK
jgi:hypothetical protein